jgi:TPR repeat protein
MKAALLVTLAATALAGCASAPQAGPASGSTHSMVASEQSFTYAGLTPQSSGSTLQTLTSDTAFGRLQASALTGDRDAMFRLGQIYARGSDGVARDDKAMVQWLRRASELDHSAASYQLYLYYVKRGLDRDAVHFENLAVKQGYVLPWRLDPRRG